MELKYREELASFGYNVTKIEQEDDTSAQTLVEVNTIEKYLEVIELLTNSIVIDVANAGSCSRCGGLGAIIDISFEFGETTFHYGSQCANCSIERIKKVAHNYMLEIASDINVTYPIINNYDVRVISGLMAKRILTPRMPIVTMLECPACRGSVFHPDEWPNGYGTGVLVNHVVAHENCTWTCNECKETELIVYERNSRSRLRIELDGKPLHPSCLIKLMQKEYPDDNIVTISDIPEGIQCSACKNYCLHNSLTYFDWLDDVECTTCANNYRSCGECSWDYNAHDMDSHDCEGNQNSDGDDDNDNNGDHRIHNYSYKPRAKFQGNDSHVYTGLELEVEADDDEENLSKGVDVMERNQWGKAFYLKYDGSIQYGFEIVSHPHTLKAWHEVDWSFLTILQKMGYRSWNTTTCGIHVHLGLKAFKDEGHEIRFAKLIYDNQRQVERIAGRSNSGYASFENGKGSAVKKIKNKNMDSNHFAALNVSNGITFEIRVFKGSLRKERVLSAIEFVNALCEYSRNLKVSYKKKPFSWGAFVSYVGNNIDLYPNLFIIINETFDNTNEISGEND